MGKLKERLKKAGSLLKKTFNQWNDREPFNNAVIIAYYTIFSLPGLLVILINVAGYFMDSADVSQKVTGQIQGMVGGDSAKQVQAILDNSNKGEETTIASVLAIATLLFGATGVFYQTQQILNKMWEVKPQPKQMIFKVVRDRVFSFGLILVIGFLLLVSLALSAGLHALGDWLTSHVSGSLVVMFKVLDFVLSVGIITLLFAAMYKFLPDAKIEWKDVWIGALFTAILFVIAKFLLGLYFGNTDPGSAYGAAGSMILIMLWVTYAGMILLFGAEFTQVYANQYGHKVQPAKGAVSTRGEDHNGAIVNKKPNSETSGKNGSSEKPVINTTTTVITKTTKTVRKI